MRGRGPGVRLCPPPRVEEAAPDTRVQGCCRAPGGQSPRWGGGDASALAPRCSPPPPSQLRRQNRGAEALLEGCTHGGGCTSSRGEVSWGSRQQLGGMVGRNKEAEGGTEKFQLGTGGTLRLLLSRNAERERSWRRKSRGLAQFCYQGFILLDFSWWEREE